MQEECLICMCEIKNKITTSCGHSYCKDCITSWCSENDSCPLCRKEIKKEIKTQKILPKTRIGILRKMIHIENLLSSKSITEKERETYISYMTILYEGLNI